MVCYYSDFLKWGFYQDIAIKGLHEQKIIKNNWFKFAKI